MKTSKTKSAKVGRAGRYVSEARRDPVAAIASCREAFKSLRAGYYRELYDILAVAVSAADTFRTNLRTWKRFQDDAFWKTTSKAKPTDRKECLLPVLHSMFNGQKYDRAWRYARGLQRYLDENVKAKDVPARLKADGGIDELCRLAIAEDPRRQTKVGEADESKAELRTGKTNERKQERPELLALEVTKKQRRLLRQLRPGERALLRVERLPSKKSSAICLFTVRARKAKPDASQD